MSKLIVETTFRIQETLNNRKAYQKMSRTLKYLRNCQNIKKNLSI